LPFKWSKLECAKMWVKSRMYAKGFDMRFKKSSSTARNLENPANTVESAS
jgi:hypothetical protein